MPSSIPSIAHVPALSAVSTARRRSVAAGAVIALAAGTVAWAAWPERSLGAEVEPVGGTEIPYGDARPAALTWDDVSTRSAAAVATTIAAKAPAPAAPKATAVPSTAPKAAAAPATALAAKPAVPPVGNPKAFAASQLARYGWAQSQMTCLDRLWQRESGWNPHAANRRSGAYGIPQALPGSKMASAGADWRTNPNTQVTWGLRYIKGTYGSPCAAWSHSQRTGWY